MFKQTNWQIVDDLPAQIFKHMQCGGLACAQHAGDQQDTLAIIAFVESSFFPIPPDVLMIPMIIAAPTRAFRIAAVATVASLLGGLFGYAIGALLFETVGQPILDFYGKADAFESFAIRYNDWGAWAVLIAGVTPFPFKVITIASGATGLSLPVFIVSAILAYSRGLIRELLAIAGWIVAAIVAFVLAPTVEPWVRELPYLGDILGDSCELTIIAAFAAVFAVTLMIVALFTVYTEFIRFQTAVFEKFTVDHRPRLVPLWVERAVAFGLAVAAQV